MALFKIDAVGGNPAPGNDVKLRDALNSCLALRPDLIILNHRVDLGAAQSLSTTTLWQGDETYIDVKISNNAIAPHHRQGAMNRGLTQNLTRLVEDHGVCLSSCMDAWDDDLILSAFGRSLIVSPEIYGNPWLLKDSEFPKLARIYNLHERYGSILVNGLALPASYGPAAVSRGDSNTRFVVLKNLTWAPVSYTVRLTSEIGVSGAGTYEVRQLHPTEKIIGSYLGGNTVSVTVDPFRACLLLVSNSPIAEVGITGANYQVQQDKNGEPVTLKVMGQPGTSASISLRPGSRSFNGATLNGTAANQLVSGGSATVNFPGTALSQPVHRSLGTLSSVSVPSDAEALYEATCFAADNNALEARSLARAGTTAFTQVQAARDAFFNALRPANYSNGFGAPIISDYGMWDKYAFDNNNGTSFTTQRAPLINGGGFRIDFGAVTTMTQLRFYNVQDSLTSLNAQVSSNLSSWTTIPLTRSGSDLLMNVSGTTFRYLRIAGAINRVTEIRAFNGATELNRSQWRAANLFGAYAAKPAVNAWSLSFTLPEAPEGSYFCVGLEGTHGAEGAYAAARINGVPVGATDRATSFMTGMWETGPEQSSSNYTYYIPVKPSDAGKTVDLVVLGLSGTTTFTPKAYITAPTPYTQAVDLVLAPSGGGSTSYALTVNNGSGSGNYTAGSAVMVSANSAPAGQQFAGWTGDTATLANPASASTIFTMPAAAAAITATYSPLNPTTYVLTVNNGSGSGSYAAGTTVTIAANSPPAGQAFAGWTGNTAAVANVSAATTTVTMPSSAVTVTATYASSGGDKIRFYPRAGYPDRMMGGVFEGTNGDPVTGTYTVIHTIGTLPAASAWTEVNVSLGTYRYLRYRAGSSSWCNVAEVEFYRAGTKLSGTGYGTAGSFNGLGDTFDKALDGNTATFFDSTQPAGAYVGIDTTGGGPTTYALTVNSGSGDGSYAAGTSVTISADAAPAGQAFAGWTGNTSALASASSATTTVTMPAAAVTVTATYAPTSGGGDKIRYYPRSGFPDRMVGGVFEGTNGDPNTGTYTVIHTIAAQPPVAWTEVQISLGTYRYLRYRAPNSGFGNVAEVEFYRAGSKLSGPTFGTPGSYNNLGDTYEKVFDSNTSTYFDSTQPHGAYAGIDTGGGGGGPTTYALTVNSGSGDGSYAAGTSVTITADAAPAGQVFAGWTGDIAVLANATQATTTVLMPSSVVTVTATYTTSGGGGGDKIRFYPRAGYPDRMVGGVFEGTNGDPATGTYTTIHTISTLPAAAAWTEVNGSLGTYRYLRYRAGNSSWCNVAEVEFYRSGTKLNGTPYGTPGSFQGSGNTFAKVFDGNTSTYFDSTQPAGAYAGIDTSSGGGGPATYTLTVINGTGSGSYAAGTSVTVSANTPPAGQAFAGWTGDTAILSNPTLATTSALVPSMAVTITATYAPTGGGGSLPSPWASMDIGSPAPAGNAAYSSGSFTVQGSGADIWDSSDSFHFVYRTMNGDGTIVAKVDSMTNPNVAAKAGVMMRSGLGATASNVFACVMPNNVCNFQRRLTDGATTTANAAPAAGAPRWVRIIRSGSTFTVAHSADGTNWNTLGSASVTMPSTIYIGLAVTSHAPGSLCSGVFSSVTP
jgi:regulation of enolase protein 1 (concanavalin A-like superfamily)